MLKTGTNLFAIWSALCASAEGSEENGWRDVYLDNALPKNMAPTTFRSYLAKLSQAGVYRPVDGYAWGKVKVNAVYKIPTSIGDALGIKM